MTIYLQELKRKERKVKLTETTRNSFQYILKNLVKKPTQVWRAKAIQGFYQNLYFPDT